MFISRAAESAIRDHLTLQARHKAVLVVRGARQVGKTTLIEHLLSTESRVLALNLQEEQQLAEQIDSTENFQTFEQLLTFQFDFVPQGSTLYIDEAQESSKLGSYVRFMKERWPGCTVILSGSMMSDFFSERYPVGRVKEIILRPLTFEEFLGAKGRTKIREALQTYKLEDDFPTAAHQALLQEVDEYFRIGGLPEVVLDYCAGKNWGETRNVIANGFRRDFAIRYGADKASQMWRAFRTVAKHVGSPSKYTQVLAANAPGYKALPGIISQLEHWHLVLLSEQSGAQPETDLHPKRYLFDIGVAQQFRYLARPLPLLHQNPSADVKQALGGLVENFLATELTFLTDEIAGYRERTYEIDFVFETIPVESKASQKVRKSQYSRLIKYCNTYGVSTGICFNLAPPQHPEYYGKSLESGLRMLSLPIYMVGQLKRLVS